MRDIEIEIESERERVREIEWRGRPEEGRQTEILEE